MNVRNAGGQWARRDYYVERIRMVQFEVQSRACTGWRRCEKRSVTCFTEYTTAAQLLPRGERRPSILRTTHRGEHEEGVHRHIRLPHIISPGAGVQAVRTLHESLAS